jgi:nitrite reductase (NADH) small subunit
MSDREPGSARELRRTPEWTAVCPYRRLEPERGVAALVDGVQVALFRLFDGRVFAIGNRDPIAGAYVLSRGIVGTRGDAPTVASPLYKEAYDLRTGECLDSPGVRVPTFPVRCHDGMVYLATGPDTGLAMGMAGAGSATER